MLVVSDTSVLLNLAVIDQTELLRQLFAVVMAPAAVQEEFARLVKNDARFRSARWPKWVVVRRPAAVPASLFRWSRRLDQGEREAIALALELRADLILIDEEAARSAAKACGLEVTGLAGVLIRAKEAALISSVAMILDRIMDDAGFWIGSAFRREVLLLAGECPEA